jgi:hypothetical protein
VSASGGPARYEIRVEGVLDSRWAAWFNGLQISGRGDETVICGLLADQPALHGLVAHATLKKHVTQVQGELGAANCIEAAARACQLGLIP